MISISHNAAKGSVTDVVQTLSWLFGSQRNPQTRLQIFTNNKLITMKKQRREFNVLHDNNGMTSDDTRW